MRMINYMIQYRRKGGGGFGWCGVITGTTRRDANRLIAERREQYPANEYRTVKVTTFTQVVRGA